MNLLHFDSEQAWTNAIVSLWRDRLRTDSRLRMCLPSGNTPLGIYAAMAQSVRAGHVSFRDAEIFALDDFGGLAPDDDGKCANMLRHHLIDPIQLPTGRFHFIDTDAADLDAVCREYDGLIGAGFDLTILGIGMNGHLGLNEPGSATESTTRRVELHVATVAASAGYLKHSNLPSWGIGVGLKQLLDSKEVWLLANGAKKAEIVRRALQDEITSDVPASLLRKHPNSSLFVDGEAGALL